MALVNFLCAMIVYLLFFLLFGSDESMRKAPPMKHRIKRF